MPAAHHKITIGISACLLGENVRYNGDNSYASLITQQLGERFNLRPICPEVAIGLGVPRDPIQLVKTNQGMRVHNVRHGNADLTEQLTEFAESSTQTLPGICGYIFKSRSPSCGIGDTKVFNKGGELIHNNGTGAFAGAILKGLPDLPVADEIQLQQQTDIEEFIARVIRYSEAHQNS